MRHRVLGRKLGRDINSRKALFNNLANSIFLHGQIKTTLAKAKFTQGGVEKIITSAKKIRLGNRRVIAQSLSKAAFLKLINEIAPGFEKRIGGYTRIVKLAPRSGDNAPMARIELLPWEKVEAKKTKLGVKSTRKSEKSLASTKNKSAKSKPDKQKSTKKKNEKVKT